VNGDLILVVVIGTALVFDFTNGFHDTANVVATSISTRAMKPRVAVTFAAILNFVGAFLSLKVAATVGQGLVESDAVTLNIVFAGLVGAIAWNIATWYYGLPSSSSHALLGGLVGAVFFAVGADAVKGDGVIEKVLVPALLSPVLAFIAAGVSLYIAYGLTGRYRPGPMRRGFRLGQIISAGLLALSHGTNDGQKTMGVMTLALIAHGNIAADNFHVPDWVVISAASAIALGTYTGGWRIINTMGNRIHKMDEAQGFAAQGAGAVAILSASHFGFPLSTTHTISGAVIGSGAAKRLSAVRWGVARNILIAWVLTFPAAACTAGLVYAFTWIFGNGATGPVIVSMLSLCLLITAITRRSMRGAPTPAHG
jgi:PiT family inorganic phosphate transporter